MSFVNPLREGPLVFVAGVGGAEGARGAAAALTCAGAEADVAALMVDLGARAPRPTLVASAAARTLEERLAAHLPEARAAARGQVCHLALPADAEGLAAVASAVDVARGMTMTVHLQPELLQAALSAPGFRTGGVLLRADLRDDRALVGLAVRDLISRGVAAAVLKRRLSWVAERRALFGILPPGAPGALPPRLVGRLAGTAR